MIFFKAKKNSIIAVTCCSPTTSSPFDFISTFYIPIHTHTHPRARTHLMSFLFSFNEVSIAAVSVILPRSWFLRNVVYALMAKLYIVLHFVFIHDCCDSTANKTYGGNYILCSCGCFRARFNKPNIIHNNNKKILMMIII